MWEGLDEIAWEDLSHAYGSAADVPQMLLALNSDDAEVRDDAFSNAYGNIFHQGSRYEATPYAVPFLLQILRRPGYPAVNDMLYYLASLVVGYDTPYITDGFAWEIERHRKALEECRADPDRQDSAEYLQAIVRITDEVRRGVDDYVRLLQQGSAEVRLAAMYLLAFLPESYPEFSDALLEVATSEPDVCLRGNALIALAMACEPADAPRQAFEEALRSDQPFLRTTAAMGLAILGVESPAVICALLSVIDDSTPIEVAFPWHFEEGATVATLCLAKICQDPEALLDSLEHSLQGMGTMQAANTVSAVMELLFPHGPVKETEALTPPQRRWLAFLAGITTPWEFDPGTRYGNFSLMMRDYGLPASREELAAFLDEE